MSAQLCCSELQAVLQDADSGIAVIQSDGKLGIRMDLGNGSYITSETCVFCENHVSQSKLKAFADLQSNGSSGQHLSIG
jgi:hypothetical protein